MKKDPTEAYPDGPTSPSAEGRSLPLTRGQVIGNYRILGLIGQGGMGAVFEALHLYIERRAAIKVLFPEHAQNPQLVARFLNEARAVNRVRHPGLVEIYEFGLLPDRTAYIVMEFLEGLPLSVYQERAPDRRLPEAEVLGLARQIASALQAAHAKSIVHRDLKPENVMLVTDPEYQGRLRAKILDFGVAKMVTGGPYPEVPFRTRTGMALGTPEYMSPEQCTGALGIDGKADVYALGVMIYEMLAGRLPFCGELPFDTMAMHVRADVPVLRAANPAASAPVELLVAQMMAKVPAQRPPMSEVVEQLDLLSGILGPGAPFGGSRSGPLSPPDSAAHGPLSPTVPMQPTPSPASGPAAEPGQSRRILVVDDEPDLANTLCNLLSAHGFSCHAAYDGGVVMGVMREYRPDLVILDVELPGKSGYKLCWEIKSTPTTSAVPVILLSAKRQEMDHKMGMAMQADAYVDKPFQIEELLGVINLLLSPAE